MTFSFGYTEAIVLYVFFELIQRSLVQRIASYFLGGCKILKTLIKGAVNGKEGIIGEKKKNWEEKEKNGKVLSIRPF